MANREPFLSFLIGIGIKSLSVAPQYVPRVREVIRNIAVAEACQHAEAMARTGRLQPVPEPVGEGDEYG